MLAYNNNGLRGRVVHAVMTGVVVILLSLVAASMARLVPPAEPLQRADVSRSSGDVR